MLRIRDIAGFMPGLLIKERDTGPGIEVDFPAFEARLPWFGGDLQTVRNYLLQADTDLSGFASDRVWLPLADGSGDVLAGSLLHPEDGPTRGPLVVLIHGLTGSEDSFYIRASTAYHLGRGYRVLRLNLRGAGPSRETCRFQYHAGRSEDLHAALKALDPALTENGLALVGYSLGGNMLLKFLAEFGRSFPITAAASISAPIDLIATSKRLGLPRNRIYHRWLLYHVKQETVAGSAAITEREAAAIEAARTIYEYDRDFAAPRNGYAGAEEYYEKNMARPFIGEIRTPTLIIHAHDDPWIPVEPYLEVDWGANPWLTLLLSRRGGHVGFHAVGDRYAWHDRCVGQFIEALTV